MVDNQQIRILVIDDNADIRNLLRSVLERAGYLVNEAIDGEEAVDLIADNFYNVVLLDISLPGASGMEVLSWITENAPDTCAVMVTAVTDVNTAVESMKLGAYDYITKPFTKKDVLNKVTVSIMRKNLDIEEKKRVADLERTITEKTLLLLRQFAELVETLAKEHSLLHQIAKNQAGIFEELSRKLLTKRSSTEEFSETILKMRRRQLDILRERDTREIE
ncbi:MAG: response regulator [Chitinispirillaceae bacterium]|nr:response regulator [Chitinispirillaceae bacterium]